MSIAQPEKSGQGKRQTILEATLRVISRDGIDRLTHRAIAAEAGVPLGLTTYYFESKDDIVAQTLEYVCNREIERLEERAGLVRDASFDPGVGAEMIATWAAEQVNGEGRADLVAQYVLQLQAARRPELRWALEEWNRASLRVAEATLTAIGSAHPEADARLLIAAVDGLRLYELSHGELRFEKVRERVERLLLALVPDPDDGAG